MNLNLDRLNPQQRQAVEVKDGVYQIVSVAGSGKTEVLTKRVGYLIGYHGVFPDEILLLTFSKAAAEEMKQRMKKIIKPSIVDEITIGTFHSLAYRILKREYTKMNNPLAKAFSFGEDSGVLSGYAQKNIIETILKDELGIDLKKKGTLTALEVIQRISAAKNELIDVNQFILECMTEKDFQIAEAYRLYEAKKTEECLLDFDDMLIKLYQLFCEYPLILKMYQSKFKYLLIDEAQDNNFAQYKLIEMLSAPHNNIFLVGDDDQSMYRFRGARPDQFVNFRYKYKNTQIINLERNYRSIPAILEVANNLIGNNTVRILKKLIPFLQPNVKETSVTYQVADSTDDEATLIADKIEKMVEQSKRSYNDFAIIYRTNSQSMSLENELIIKGIPYVIYGGVSFYERKEIKDIISYLKLANDPHDNEAFERVVNTPSRYLGKAFMNIIKEEAKKRKCSFYEALKTAKLTPLQHKNSMEYFNLIKKIHEFGKFHTANQVLDLILAETKYEEFIKKEIAHEEDNDVVDNIFILKSALEKYQNVKDFVSFYKQLTGSRKQKAEAVKLMTIHKSKGLEFPVVFGAGLSEGILPHKYSIESGDPTAIEEERRLAYVLYTRAKEELHSFSPLKFGKRDLSPSRFVGESGLDKLA